MITKPIIEELKEEVKSPYSNISYIDIDQVRKNDKLSMIKILKYFYQPARIVEQSSLIYNFIENKLTSLALVGFEIAFMSIFLNFGKIFSYREQLAIIITNTFSSYFMMVYGLSCFLSTIISFFKTVNNNSDKFGCLLKRH